MTKLFLQKESIQPRLDGIQQNLVYLRTVARLPLQAFSKPEVIERVHHNLRLILEGVFNITAHILSRMPGSREAEYKAMAKKLGELGVVDIDFANQKLVKMAGYRNRLTHFYASVDAEELYMITNNNLDDVEAFLGYIKKLLENPEKFGLQVG